MFRSPGRLLLSAVLASVVLGGPPASAKILLKPKGENALPLRTKSLTADVTIDRQFATTHLTLTFQNETPNRIEADFIYTLPPEAVATYFAYWFGEEKVVARVVEKERAAAIYQHITSRMRDPALVELIGQNTFRARIFPVMPNSDLKVEMRLVQVLPSDPEGVLYEFPLREEKEPTYALDSLNVNVQVKADASLEKVTNNYGLPVTEDGDVYRVTLSGTNYRSPKNLRIRLLRKAQTLQAALYAAPSGGRDGFFALALTPDRSLTRPTVSLRGISTYQVVPARLPNVRAHHTLALFGRYRGHGRAAVTLTGASPNGRLTCSQNVEFGSKSEPNNLATKLWAARRIEQLSASAANRSTVIALSMRFGIPSKFTSWLAVPKAELERYRREKIEADIEVVARQLAKEIDSGRGTRKAARQLRTQLRGLCQQIRVNPQDVLHSHLVSRMYELAHHLVNEKHSAKPNAARIASLRRELNRLAHATGESADGYINNAEYPWNLDEIEALRDQLLSERRKEKPDAQKIKRWEERFMALYRKIGSEAYGKARTERLAVRTDLEKVDQAIETAPADSTQLAELEKRRAELLKREEELRARMGDPLISVEAPADAEQVVALLPHGEVKPLTFNPDKHRWEARFDIPAYAAEGEYVITVIIVLQDGTRKVLTLRYRVDLTPPTGAGQAQVVTAAEPTLRLEVDASEDTARVAALLPWGERVELKPSTQPHRFFTLVPVPPAQPGTAFAVTFMLTDQAHNRTTVQVEVAEGKGREGERGE